MKKIILLIVFILIIFVSGCSNNPYPDKKIESIEYSNVTSIVPKRKDIKIDFINNTVLSREYIEGEGEVPEFEIVGNFTEQGEKKFIKNIIRHRVFAMKKKYYLPVLDGSVWTFDIVFDDNTKFSSEGYGSRPRQAKKIDKECYELFGDDIFGTLPSEHFHPEIINAIFMYQDGNHYYSGTLGTCLVNYTWYKIEVNDINIVEKAELYSPLQLVKNVECKLAISNSNKSEKFNRLKMYTMDLDGSNKKLIGYYETFEHREWILEANKIYFFIAEYDHGIVESLFTTTDIE